MKSFTIRERVLFVALIPAAAIALALAGYFLALRYADAEEALASRGRALARQFAPAAEYGAFSGNREELRRLAETLRREPDVTAVLVHDRAGALLARAGTPRLEADPLALPDGWSGPNSDGGTLGFHAKIPRTAIAADDPLFLPPGARPRESLGSVTVEMSRADVVARKREMMVVALLVAVTALALGALLARRLGRDVTEPILGLQAAVERIRGGQLETRVTPHPAQTLRPLEDGVNEMAAALQAGRERLESRVAEATAELKQRKEEAERANAAKSRFLAAASHDLRQPLHALSLFAAELAHEAGSERQHRLAGQINTAVGSLRELLDSLLDISRLDMGAPTPEREPVALAPLLERVVAAHGHSARAKGLRLNLAPSRAWALTDPRLLERMVGNLVANAVRYTFRGGIVVGVRHAGDNLRVEVWDSGIGIAPEHQRLVFQEFFQVANPERDPGKGLGLGLALVERLARVLGHPLYLRSEPGRGSVFGIGLPRCAPLPAPEADSGRMALGRFEARVLVFGSSSAACESLCRLLSSWGCQVTCAQTGTQAALLLTGPPDLIVCEDDRCGEALPFIKVMAASGHPPDLILIGHAPAGLNTEGIAGGRVMRLAKPIQPAKLRALMRYLLEEPQPGRVTT